MVTLSCILPHPPPCLQLRICFPPLKNTQRRWEKKLARRWVHQADSWTCVYFPLGGRTGNGPGVGSPPPAWLCSGLWLWSRSCVAAAFLVEVQPAAACIAFSLSFTKVCSCSCLIFHLHPWLDGLTRNLYQNTQNHSLSNAFMKLWKTTSCAIFSSLLSVF